MNTQDLGYLALQLIRQTESGEGEESMIIHSDTSRFPILNRIHVRAGVRCRTSVTAKPFPE